MARTDNLTNFLTDVATAIKTKKGDETPISASNFDTEITNLPTSGGSKFAPTYVKFDNYTGTADKLDLKNLDTSNITNMSSMFNGCSGLKSLDLSNFNTNNVTNMKSMFDGCGNLTTLDVSSFNTGNVINMQQMFYSCTLLNNLDLSNFNTSNVTNMYAMFSGCNSLSSLNLNSFDTSKVTNMGGMFGNCKKITTLDLSSFNTSNVTNMKSMFYNCYIKDLKIKIANCDCDLHYCPLTTESVAYILQNLGTVTTTRTLTLGATNLAKATQEDLDSATAKGWTVN